MIIARSPLRISFAGGGTDLPIFYESNGPGVVVSTSINKYVYVTLNAKFSGGVSVRYRIHEVVEKASELRHALIREILMDYGIESGIELVIVSEVPARGSGLGASSALAVALCAALEVFIGSNWEKTLDGYGYKAYLAERASHIEIVKCGSPIGKQDHCASAFGGVNRFIFSKDGISCEQFPRNEFISELESQSLLFYLNIEREYSKAKGNFSQRILEDQVQDAGKNMKLYELQRYNAEQLWSNMKYEVMERFIDHVNENWRLKKRFHTAISSPMIDEVIQRAYRAGATSAKVCGAGGGGFVYFTCQPDMQDSLRSGLSELFELKFRFEDKGVEVVFDDNESARSYASKQD